MKHLLLIGYDEHLALSTAYCLRQLPYRIILLTHRTGSVARYSRFIDQVYFCQNYQEIVPKATEIAQEHELALIFPFDELESLTCSQERNELEKLAPLIPITAPHFFEIAIDKIKLRQFLKEAEYPYLPISYSLTELRKALPSDSKFPLLAKPGRSSAGRGIIHLQDQEALKSWLKSNQELQDGDFFLQTYLAGQDINCNVFCVNGRVLEFTVQESPDKQAGSFYRNDDLTFTHSEEVLAVVKPVLKALNWNGLACIDLRREKKSGRLYLLEINARVWASVMASYLRAGVNFPSLAVQISLALKQQPLAKKNGIQISIRQYLSQLHRLGFLNLRHTKYWPYLNDSVARLLKYLPH